MAGAYPEPPKLNKLLEISQSLPQLPWYALRVKGRHEKSVAKALRDQGYAEFLPLYTSTSQWSDRVRVVEVPLFPGYLFCRFDWQEPLPVLRTPGVIDVVKLGRLPHAVDEGEIAALHIAVSSGLLLQPWPFLKEGQQVVIQEGPLRNVEGYLAEIRGDRKLILSITLLQRSVAVCVERAWVRPLVA